MRSWKGSVSAIGHLQTDRFRVPALPIANVAKWWKPDIALRGTSAHAQRMKRLLIIGVAIIGGALIASNVQGQRRDSPFVVNLKPAGDGCRIRVEEGEVTSDRLFQLARAAAGRRGIVVFHRDTPYRCIGSAIYALQRAGLVHVDSAMWGGD